MKVIKRRLEPYIIEMTAEIDLSDRDNIRDRLYEIKSFYQMLDRLWQYMEPGPK